MSHLNEKIEVSNVRELETAVYNEYGQVTISGDFGKKIAEAFEKPFYTEGITADINFNNVPTETLDTTHNIFYAVYAATPGCFLTRNDYREYAGEAKDGKLILTHRRNTL